MTRHMTSFPVVLGLNRRLRLALSPVVLCAMVWSAGCRTAPLASDSKPGVPGGENDVVRIHPGLVINVTVLVNGKKELEETNKRVSDTGSLPLPLLGAPMVADLTLDELSAKLTSLYRKYFVNPQVIVEFASGDAADGSSPWGYVTVLGRVKNPGRIAIPATRDLTVSGAIQKAGGVGSSAKIDAILITIPGSDGKSVTRTIDLHAVGAGGRIKDDIVVSSGDVVFVPERTF